MKGVQSVWLTMELYEELVALPEVRDMVQGYINELNARLERWETIKKFEILQHDLTVEDGDMTSSMKVRRKLVEQKYMNILDSMYESA